MLISLLSFFLMTFFFLMTLSTTKSITLTVSVSEAESISVIAQRIVDEVEEFSSKHGVSDQFDKTGLRQDLALFLVERNKVGLETLRVSILEDGVQVGDAVEGTRVADLIFNIVYKDRGYEY